MLKLLFPLIIFGARAFASCEGTMSPPTVSIPSLLAVSTVKPQMEQAYDSLHKEYGPVFQTPDGMWFIADVGMINEITKNTVEVGRVWENLWRYLGKDSFFLKENHIPEQHQSWHTAFKAIAAHLKPKTIEQQTAVLKAAVISAIESFMREKQSEEISLDEFGFYMAYSSAMRFLFSYVPSMREVQMVQKKGDDVFTQGVLDNAAKVLRKGKYLEEVARELQNHGEFNASPTSLYASLKAAQVEAGYSEQWLRDQVKTLVWASFETTQSTIAAVLWHASRHPEWGAKVREAYLGVGETPPENNPTIRAFINETLRLNPPINGFPRVAVKKFNLQNYVVPEGTILNLNIYSAHRRLDQWGPDARFFRPDRLDINGCSMVDTNMTVPFGAGPRRCIGQFVALGEVAYVLGEMLKRYDIKIETYGLGFPLVYDGTLRTHWGELKLKARQ